MNELYELKEMLCDELKEYGRKGELKNTGALEVVDKLTHTIKNLDKIIEKYEEEDYSGADGYYMGSYRNEGGRGGSYRGGSYREGSYARGRGRNARRDSMGRYSSEGYSRNDGMVMELRDLMQDAPDERTKQEFERFIKKIEAM